MREPLSFKVFRVVILTVLTLFVLVPMWVLFTSSVKPLGDVQGKKVLRAISRGE